MSPIFFDVIDSLVWVLITAPVLYIIVIIFMHISGKRSASKINNFDWIVTVAMGSLMGSVILLDDVVVWEVVTAIFMLTGLQYLVAQGIIRSSWLASVVKPEPRLLVLNGMYLDEAMKSERVTRAAIKAAMRAKGALKVADVVTIIFETDTSLSVIVKADTQPTLVDIPKRWGSQQKAGSLSFSRTWLPMSFSQA